MNKSITGTLFLLAFTIPVISFAGAQWSVGGRVDGVSGGVELRLTLPNQRDNAAFFIAPHGIAVFTNNGEQTFEYSAGLRTGVMFMPSKWFSPLIGIGAGHNGDITPYSREMSYGGRAYAGASIAPFDALLKDSDKLSTLRALRLEFDVGFMYLWKDSEFNHPQWGHHSSHDEAYILPDVSVGITLGL
ncbi:hypothetical protein JXM67_02565 [candidate division WOR-3 bacterium]|nr:hypothetical protein [candidate division WOR-3 bacterium]